MKTARSEFQNMANSLPLRLWTPWTSTRCARNVCILLAFLAPMLFLTKNYILENGQFINDAWEDNMGNRLKDDKPVNVLQEFYRVVDFFDIQAVVIEPRILFDIIDTVSKDMLLRKGFSVVEPSTNQNITLISFALIGNNTRILNEKLSSSQILPRCMKYWAAFSNAKTGEWVPDYFNNSRNFSSHHFFQCQDTLIHGIVFYERENYYWHPALPSDISLPIRREDLTFVNPSAYERFTAIPERYGEDKKLHFYKPSLTTRFLKEIESSKFIECDLWRASSLKLSDTKKTTRYNTLKVVFTDSLDLLKKLLHPQLKMFFIFAGTLLGWYRQCDIIPYTTDVDFATWSSDIGSAEFWTKTFEAGKSDLRIGELMGLPEKGFEISLRMYGNKVDMFFIYKNETMSWAYGHRPSLGYYFSYNYPKFSLCSGDLLGHKVLVPCNAEEVIRAEYGPHWRKSATSWYYETHPRNMGERKYWSKEERKKVSKLF